MYTLKDINKLINEIIPPDDYQHRNGFSNEHIIDKLNNEFKSQIETKLIEMLRQKTDLLIISTLGYMKSDQSLPVLYELIKDATEGMAKIILSSSIYKINKDEKMIDIAIESFEEIEKLNDAYFIYRIIPTFYYLASFNNPKTKKLIVKYTNHNEYLISYNAKQSLNML